jgi:hypothetical protein
MQAGRTGFISWIHLQSKLAALIGRIGTHNVSKHTWLLANDLRICIDNSLTRECNQWTKKIHVESSIGWYAYDKRLRRGHTWVCWDGDHPSSLRIVCTLDSPLFSWMWLGKQIEALECNLHRLGGPDAASVQVRMVPRRPRRAFPVAPRTHSPPRGQMYSVPYVNNNWRANLWICWVVKRNGQRLEVQGENQARSELVRGKYLGLNPVVNLVSEKTINTHHNHSGRLISFVFSSCVLLFLSLFLVLSCSQSKVYDLHMWCFWVHSEEICTTIKSPICLS